MKRGTTKDTKGETEMGYPDDCGLGIEVGVVSGLTTRRASRDGGSPLIVRLSVSLTTTEAEVFFRMLAMSTGEQTDEDFEALTTIEQKFNEARKPNTSVDTRYASCPTRVRQKGGA